MLSSTKMLFYRNIVVEKHCCTDGLIISTFSLRNEECLLGRAAEGCDIQIDLPTVSREHAKLKVQVTDGAVNITALSKTNNTKLNGVAIPNDTPVLLYQSDVVTIEDRHFRWLLSKWIRTVSGQETKGWAYRHEFPGEEGFSGV